jgi:hypothetical protein
MLDQRDCAMLERKIVEELRSTTGESLPPVEKKLIGWSLGIGVGSLAHLCQTA